MQGVVVLMAAGVLLFHQFCASSVPSMSLSTGNGSRCGLEVSSEMFGGVREACGHLERRRCCPVLWAWLLASHAASALQAPPPQQQQEEEEDLPLMPETESLACADALQASLAARNISFPRPNATCDAVLCFCGIRFHDIRSLPSCPAAFTLSGAALRPTPALRSLQRHCLNASYAGCTHCLSSLLELKSGGGGGGGGERMEQMMDRDCRLMGLTWLLAKNKSAYIPTVSAVLRAVFYSEKLQTQPYLCSADQDNMPLAVDSLHFERPAAAAAAYGQNGSVSRSAPGIWFYLVLLPLSVVAVHVAGLWL